MKVRTHVPSSAVRPNFGTRLARAWADLSEGFGRWHLWTTLAWQDVQNRYRRSLLGPFWLTISMGAFIAGLAYLYSGLMGRSLQEYLPHLGLGIILWSLISSTVSDGCRIFIAAAAAIRLVKAPLSVHFFKTLWKGLLNFAHLLVLVPLVLGAGEAWPGLVGWQALLGFPILFAACAGAALTLSVVCVRFRDVPPMIAMVMRVGFFFTPIIWQADVGGARAAFVYLNPFYYLLEVVRAPLLGRSPEPFVWLVAVLLAAAACACGMAFYARFRHRIPFWV